MLSSCECQDSYSEKLWGNKTWGMRQTSTATSTKDGGQRRAEDREMGEKRKKRGGGGGGCSASLSSSDFLICVYRSFHRDKLTAFIYQLRMKRQKWWRYLSWKSWIKNKTVSMFIYRFIKSAKITFLLFIFICHHKGYQSVCYLSLKIHQHWPVRRVQS